MKIVELLFLGSKNKTTGKNNISKNLQIFYNQNVIIKCNIKNKKKKIKSTWGQTTGTGKTKTTANSINCSGIT